MRTRLTPNIEETYMNTIIRDVEFHYPHVINSHKPFGNEIWDVQIRTTDKSTVKELEDAGVKMKEHKDGYYHANVKRNVVSAKGTPNTPPVVVDKDANPWDRSVFIGNGSTGNVKLFTYDWSNAGRSGRSAMLSGLQVVDHVEYQRGEDFGAV